MKIARKHLNLFNIPVKFWFFFFFFFLIPCWFNLPTLVFYEQLHFFSILVKKKLAVGTEHEAPEYLILKVSILTSKIIYLFTVHATLFLPVKIKSQHLLTRVLWVGACLVDFWDLVVKLMFQLLHSKVMSFLASRVYHLTYWQVLYYLILLSKLWVIRNLMSMPSVILP